MRTLLLDESTIGNCSHTADLQSYYRNLLLHKYDRHVRRWGTDKPRSTGARVRGANRVGEPTDRFSSLVALSRRDTLKDESRDFKGEISDGVVPATANPWTPDYELANGDPHRHVENLGPADGIDAVVATPHTVETKMRDDEAYAIIAAFCHDIWQPLTIRSNR